MKGGSPKSAGWKSASEDTTLKVQVKETILNQNFAFPHFQFARSHYHQVFDRMVELLSLKIDIK